MSRRSPGLLWAIINESAQNESQVSDQPPLKKEDLIHHVKYIQIITKNRLHCK